MKRYLSVILLCATLAACRSTPERVGPPVTDDGSALSLAVAEAATVEDPLVKASLYQALGQAYVFLEDEENATILADAILQLTQESGASDESIRIQLGVAPMLYEAGSPDRAGTVLLDAVESVESVEFPAVRSQLLAETVRYALECDNEGLPAVRAAVDAAYVLEDPATRVETLVEVAKLYQQGGIALSVTSLIHQSVPSVRSISNPWLRAYLFGQLASLAHAAREEDIRDRLVEDAIRELSRTSDTDESDDRDLADLAAVLARIGAPTPAATAMAMIDDQRERVRALVSMAETTTDELAAHALLQSATSSAEAIDGSLSRVEAYLEIADGYLASGADATAAMLASRAAEQLSNGTTASQRLDLLLAVVRVLAVADPAQLGQLVVRQQDPFVRGSAALAASEQLAGSGDDEAAFEYLAVALAAADLADYLPDVIRLGAVDGYVTVGDIRGALAIVSSMDDHILRTQAVVTLAIEIVHSDSQDALTAEYRRLFLRRGASAGR